MPSNDHATALDDLPPSASHVYYVLEQQGPLTQADLVEEAYLRSDRTARDALRRLTDEGLVETSPASDARQRLYRLSDR